MNPRPGRLIGCLIVAGWLVLLGARVFRSDPHTGKAEWIDLSTPATDTTLVQRGVFYRGARIGYLRERRRPEGEGFRMEQRALFSLNVMGRERTLRMGGDARVGKNGELETFTIALTTESGSSPFETTIEGEVTAGELVLTIHSGSGTRVSRRPLDRPLVLPLNLYPAIAARGLAADQTFRLELFDPLTLSQGVAEVHVIEPEIVRWGEDQQEEAFRLRVSFSGLTTTAWMTRGGEVLKEETPLGWTLIREMPGTLLAADHGATAPDVVSGSAVPAIGFSGNASSLTQARLRLRAFPPELSGLDGGRQSLDGDVLLVTREVLQSPARLIELSPEEREAALASDAFVQADDPVLQKQARSLTQGLSPLEGAKALWRWVYENVRKTPTLSIPSAREVFEQRAGDCNEHTILFTALARAAGIPTRICTGLTYTGGQFYYHAWPEIWVGRWMAVDPTLGQFPADPLHVRLLVGGLEQQYEVLNVMGRGATIEVLEAR